MYCLNKKDKKVEKNGFSENSENKEINVESEQNTNSEKSNLEDSQLIELQKKYDELMDKFMRLAAEYDNFRKRSQKEKESIYSDSIIESVSQFLPVWDNLQRAVSNEKSDNIIDGVKMIVKQFGDVLNKIGVSEVPAIGEEFDPLVHNAVMHIEDDSIDTNTIIEEFAKGYKYKDKVIRHSMVKVAN